VWQTRTGASAAAVELTAALLLATAVSDALGLASVSFNTLVVGVPLTAIAGVVCFGRVVDAVNGGRADVLGRLQALLCAVLVAAVVLGAAIRAPAVPSDTIPPEAKAALALAFAVLVVQALVALVPVRRERPE
jgi:hypothetical protein